MQSVATDADAVADVEVADVAALERARAAVVEADVDAVADDGLAHVALDVVAGDRTAGCAQSRHRSATEAMAELVADGIAATTDLSPFDPARLRLLDPALFRSA